MVSAAGGLVLALDASTPQGSVALLRDGRVVAEETVAMRAADEERLLPAVARVLAAVGAQPAALAGVVCGAGPGSFTGLRIAVATAKGLAQALALPLRAVSSLALVAAAAEPALAPGRYLVTLDALRDERFVQRVSVGDAGAVGVEGPVSLMEASQAARLAETEGRVCLGPTEARPTWPHARGVARLGAAVLEAPPVSLAAWEPDYGRPAEAQARWEAAHGRRLPAG